jgi:polyisoprenoid-binding protein YceI
LSSLREDRFEQYMKYPHLLLAAFALTALASAQVRNIDTGRSKVLVHVSKAGLFSAFGDNHEIEAPISAGVVDAQASIVRLVIDSAAMKVLDPQLSPDKRQEVQERMLGPEVLDVQQFAQITFESTAVDRHGDKGMVVRGNLSLHGQKHPVVVTVLPVEGGYRGNATLKQHDYGINPVSVAGGTVKVKDELKLEFEVVMKE